MNMAEYIQTLETYVASCKANFGDGDSVLSLLYEAYEDVNRIYDDQIKTDFGELNRLQKGVAGCRKLRDITQQTISQKTTIRQCIINPLIGLAQKRYSKQMLNENHFYEHYRACARSAFVMALVRLQTFVQPFVIHNFLNFLQQMICRNQGFYVDDYGFLPRILFPLLYRQQGEFFDRLIILQSCILS